MTDDVDLHAVELGKPVDGASRFSQRPVGFERHDGGAHHVEGLNCAASPLAAQFRKVLAGTLEPRNINS